jgi:hypothetical protein
MNIFAIRFYGCLTVFCQTSHCSLLFMLSLVIGFLARPLGSECNDLLETRHRRTNRSVTAHKNGRENECQV